MKELDICRELVKWARLHEKVYPCLKWFHHISNEGKRSPRIARQIGIVPGVSDYFMPGRAYDYIGFYLEIKAFRRKPTRDQYDFIQYVRRNDYCAVWTNTLGLAIEKLEWYCKGVHKC